MFDLKADQSQKTEGFHVADFATLSDKEGCIWKSLYCFIWIKEPCVRTFERLAHSKILVISQTKISKILCVNQRYSPADLSSKFYKTLTLTGGVGSVLEAGSQQN